MFSQAFPRFTCLSKRLLSSVPSAAGLEFVKEALHRDNIKIISLVGGGLLLGGGLVAESTYILYNVLQNAKDVKQYAKENAKDLRDIEIKMAKELREVTKEVREVERVIVNQIANLQVAMISALLSSPNRHPDEFVNDAMQEA
jgi:hypothetical protein